MTTLCSWTGCLLLLALLPSDGSGQAPGTVRIRRDGTDSVVAMGQSVARSRDRFVFEAAGTRAQYTLSSDDVVERYQTGRTIGTGAKIGAVVGLGIGMALGFEQDESRCGLGDPFCGVDTGRIMAGTILGVGLGAGVGALVGSLFKKTGWFQIDPFDIPEASVQVTLIPEPGRVALAIAIRRATFHPLRTP